MRKHWTEDNKDFTFAVATDFLTEIETAMDASGVTQRELAQRLGVSEGRVSQIMNSPGNLTLRSAVEWSRALSMKVSLIPYDDGDRENENGPVFAGFFRASWEALGRPFDRWSLDAAVGKITASGSLALKSCLCLQTVQDEGGRKGMAKWPSAPSGCGSMENAA